MKKYLVLLLLVSCSSLVAMESEAERQEVKVITKDGSNISLSKDFGNKLQTIVHLVQDLGEESTEAIPLPEISSLTLRQLIEYDEKNDLLDDYSLEDHIDLFSAAFFLDYQEIEGIVEPLIKRLILEESEEVIFAKKSSSVRSAIEHNDLLREVLIKQIKLYIDHYTHNNDKIQQSLKKHKDPISVFYKKSDNDYKIILQKAVKAKDKAVSGGRSPIESTAFKIKSVHISLNSKYLVTLGLGAEGSIRVRGVLRVWNLETGELLRVFGIANTSLSPSIYLTPDGEYIVVDYFEWVNVLALETGEFIARLGATSSFSDSQVSHDGKYIIMHSDDITQIWRDATKECCCELKGHKGRLKIVCFSPNDRFVVAKNISPTDVPDNKVQVWDLETGNCMHTLEGVADEINAACMSQDGKYLVICSANVARVWNIEKGICVHSLEGHADTINSVGISKDRHIVTCSKDDTARIWDIKEGNCVRTLECASKLHSFLMSSDGNRMVTRSERAAQVWDIKSGSCIHTLMRPSEESTICAMSLSPDDSRVVTGYTDGGTYIWQIKNDEELEEEIAGCNVGQLCQLLFMLKNKNLPIDREAILGDYSKNVQAFIKDNSESDRSKSRKPSILRSSTKALVRHTGFSKLAGLKKSSK